MRVRETAEDIQCTELEELGKLRDCDTCTHVNLKRVIYIAAVTKQ